MTTSISSTSSIDPTTMATNLATAAVQNQQQLLNNETQTMQAQTSALTSLQSALSAFSSSLTSLSSLPGQSVTKYAATLGDTTLAQVSASSSAVPGSYSLSVQQLATQNAIAFASVPTTAVPTSSSSPSTITITLANGQACTIKLSAASGTMTASDIARAINQQSNGVATATVVTGQDASGNPLTQLTLSSGTSGAQGAIASISYGDASGTTSGELVPGVAFSSATQLVKAQDAIAQVNGVTVQSSTNTLSAIPGVSLTLTAAQATGAAPTTLTVSRDSSGTASQVQNFVNAYNTVKKALDGLTAIGSDGSASGAFANDSGVRSLEDGLSNMLRQSFNGTSLMSLGVSADQDGNLSLDTTKLATALNSQPTALDDVFGNASLSSPSGLLGTMSTMLNSWTDPVTGQIQQRQNSQQELGKSLTAQQTDLTNQYNDAYNRYLTQFTQLQTLQAQMAQTLSMFS